MIGRSFSFGRRWRAAAAVTLGLAYAGAAGAVMDEDADDDPFHTAPWKEAEVALPAFPQDANLREFYVGATTTNRFFLDASTLSLGSDGVARYALVIRTAGGATNVTYEGIRCDSREYKVYGLGRSDGTWAQPRSRDWRPIENKPINRHHAALAMEYLCVQTVPRAPNEVVKALKRGLGSGVNSDRLLFVE